MIDVTSESIMQAHMKQLTLRRIPEEVENELRQLARRNGTSLNHTAIEALEKGLGLAPPSRRRRDISQISARWTAEQADEFDRSTQIFSQVDDQMWR